MMNRRNLLKVLGLGVLGTGGYVVGTSNGDELAIAENIWKQYTGLEGQSASSGGNQSKQSLSERIANIDKKKIQTPVLKNRVTFDYKPLDQTFENDRLFRKVSATPTKANTGDRIKIEPGSVDAKKLATTVRAIHGVGTEISVTAGAGGKTVDLTGGIHADVAALVGIYTPPSNGSNWVIMTRGHSLKTARKLASSWTL